jgi:hypothetical protein
MEPTFFLITETYYLEATLELTFANTGLLTRTLRMQLIAPSANGNKKLSLRSALSNVNAVQLVAISDRDETTNAEQKGIFSNNFSLRAIEKEAETSVAPESGSNSNTAMVAGIAGGVAGLVVVAAFIVVAVVLKLCQRNAAAMDCRWLWAR